MRSNKVMLEFVLFLINGGFFGFDSAEECLLTFVRRVLNIVLNTIPLTTTELKSVG